ncbi:MAG: hypothetical protein APR54_09380 [Candidatus Cloacimonas sp. SDB]|nr:MAG: hypothetical protein APR54_09380 [Candidatus Cloacimonas sp. SDB]
MRKFKALLKKDLQIGKKTLLMPIWIILGYYILIAIALLIAFLGSDLQINLADIDFSDAPSVHIISYVAGLGIMSFPVILAAIFTLIMTQSGLNEDIRWNSELFHRSQPVSVWLRSLSKYVSGIAGNWLTYLAIGLLNLIIVVVILLSLNQLRLDFLLAGWLQALVGMMKITLIIGSFCFLFSALFKDKAFLQGLAIIVGIHFLVLILNFLLGWNLPLPLNNIIHLLKTNTIRGLDSFVTEKEIRHLIYLNWQDLVLSWRSLIQILVSGLLFIISTFIYKSKEIK